MTDGLIVHQKTSDKIDHCKRVIKSLDRLIEKVETDIKNSIGTGIDRSVVASTRKAKDYYVDQRQKWLDELAKLESRGE